MDTEVFDERRRGMQMYVEKGGTVKYKFDK